MHKPKSKTLTLIKEQGIFVGIQYMFLKKFAKFIAPILFRLNRPIPHNYQFYFITYHATGHNAMLQFLQDCSVSININFLESGLQRYVQNYVRVSTYPTYAALAISEYNFKDFVKYTHTLNAKVPALILVRDPISILKSIINFVTHPQEYIKIMGGGQNKLFDYLQYNTYYPQTKEFYNTNSPCLDKIESYITAWQNQNEFQSCFILNELLTSLPHITQKHYVDMSEITKDKAFETMRDLSHIFGFEKPKEADRHLFEEQAYAHLYFLFPLHLCLPIQDCTITLTLTKWAKDIDITNKIMPPSYQNNPDLENCKVYVKTHKEEQIIQMHFAQIQSELIATLETLLAIVKRKKSAALSEKDVLAYFATHPQVAREFKAICDKDLQDLKCERADIIESWQHYQAFETLCEKLF